VVAAVAAVATTLFVGGAAFADNVSVDGDTVAVATSDIVARSCSLPVTRAGLVEVKRTGGDKSVHFLPGEVLDVVITDSSSQVETTVTRTPVVVPAGFTENGANTAFTFPISTTIGPGAAVGSTTVSITVTSVANTEERTATFGVSWDCRANTAPVVTTGGVSDGASYEYGAVPAATCAWTDDVDGSGTATPTLSAITGSRAAAGLGSQTASCSATDSGGLTTTASATYSIVDTTPPVISGLSDITAEATTAAGAEVSYPSPTATDAVDGSRSVSCLPASGSTFALGTTTVTCTSSDLAPNTTTSTFKVSVVDTTAPTVTVPADTTLDATSPAGAAYSFTATATDAVDGGLTPTCTPASGSTFDFGTATVTCTATDTAGHTGSASFNVTVQDVTAPTVTVHEPAPVEATGPAGAVVSWTAPTASDDVDGDRPVTCDRDSGSTFPVGGTTVTCTAVDTRGNPGTATFTVRVTDTTPPAITVPSDITTEATSPAGAVVTYAASANDLVDGTVEVSCGPASGTEFALDQPTTVHCAATDAQGNKASASFTVTVVDTTRPELPQLSDVTAEATSAAGAAVTYGVGPATDIVDGDVSVTCAPASGSTFGLGDTAVTCSATDAHGNTAEGSFIVTVQDTTAPVLDPFSVGPTEATGPDGAVVTYPLPTATDTVDPSVDVSCDPGSGSRFALGATQVDCTAVDDSGNESTLAFIVNVVDTTGPVVGTVATQPVEATGPDGTEFTWDPVTAEDVVDGTITDVTCVPPSGSTFPLGATEVTCSARDRAGNAGQSSFMVNVVDTTAPVFSPVSNLTVTATSSAGAVVAYTSPAASDIVDGATTVTCTPPSGGTFPLGTTTVTCSTEDAAGNAASTSFTVTVVVPWSGVLSPLTNGGTYKLGSTIPVKFTLAGTSAGLTDLEAKLWVRRTSTTSTSATASAVSTSAATTGNLFRYSDGQYIFNLNTKPLQVGTYELLIDLGDGVPHPVVITLR
jgi:hypothetical protein